jgi:hypothetical protein
MIPKGMEALSPAPYFLLDIYRETWYHLSKRGGGRHGSEDPH